MGDGIANMGADARPREAGGHLAGWKVGASLAGLAGIASFQKSLLPRSGVQQIGITVASMALGYGVGVAANAIANKVDDSTELDGVTSRLAVAGVGGLAVLGTSLALRGRPSNHLQFARSAAGVLGGGAVLGAALIGEQALVDRINDDVPGGATAAHAAVFGAAALGTAAWVFGHARANSMTPDAEAAYAVAVGGKQGSSRNLATFDAAGFEELQGLRAQMRTVSGTLPTTRLPDVTVGTKGFQFITEATPAAEIARTMGVERSLVKEPVRVYGGMQHGATSEALAQKIFDEALDLGAFDRKHVMLYLPSGTGQINPVPVAATEYLTLGDVASIGMQYGDKPSTMSLHKMGTATDLFEQVEKRFLDHIDTLPADRRPTVIRYGESLGGVSLLKAFEDPATVAARGPNKLISVGTPGFSEFRKAAVGGGYRLDSTGAVFDFDNIDQLRALTDTQREGVSTYMLTHYNDPVSRMSPTLFFKRPDWMIDPAQATGIPRKMKFIPGVTGVQSVVDTVNGSRLTPGILERTGHDYRADLTPVMAEILGTPASDEQIQNIVRGLNQLELARVHGPASTPRYAGPLLAAAGS